MPRVLKPAGERSAPPRRCRRITDDLVRSEDVSRSGHFNSLAVLTLGTTLDSEPLKAKGYFLRRAHRIARALLRRVSS
jgi:hypothetical protein